MRRNVLTPCHLATRLQTWCQQRVRWTRARWRTAFFSDESRFLLSHAVGRRVFEDVEGNVRFQTVQQVDCSGGRSDLV